MNAHGRASPGAWAGLVGLLAWLTMPGLAGAQETQPKLETWILRAPSRVTADRLAEFEFESDQPHATFECALNSDNFFPCKSPLRLYSRIRLGEQYTLSVRAILGEGWVDPTPATYQWRTLPELPLQPVITEPAPGALVEERVLHVAGLAAPGGRLWVLVDHRRVAVTQADSEGEWRLTVPVEEGPHTLLAELEDGKRRAIVFTKPVDFIVQPHEPRGCSSTGGSPALLLIGLVALTLMSSRGRCPQENRGSSRGCDCCR